MWQAAAAFLNKTYLLQLLLLTYCIDFIYCLILGDDFLVNSNITFIKQLLKWFLLNKIKVFIKTFYVITSYGLRIFMTSVPWQRMKKVWLALPYYEAA